MKLLNKNLSKSLGIFFIVSLFGCKTDDSISPNNTSSSANEFLEITLSSKKYRLDFPSQFVGLSGFDNQNLCDNKKGFLLNVIDKNLDSRFEINSDLLHYKNYVDLSKAVPGSYQLSASGISNCNFTFTLSVDDNSSSPSNTSLINPMHQVTSIKQIQNSASSFQYLISGKFSGNYKNSSGAMIPVVGSYQKIIEVLK